MKWTKRSPRRVGYFWFRENDQQTPLIVRICEEEFGPNTDLFVRHGNGPDDVNFIENYHGEWAGPIPMPEEVAR